MISIALTGGIACGKSLAGSFLAGKGVPVCEADELAHRAMARGTGTYRRIVEAFGREILAPDGSIDRALLGRRVFQEPAELMKLNKIVHPEVRKLWQAWLEDRRDDPADAAAVAAVIVPLLYEAREENGWHAVVCVSAPLRLRMRFLRDRGLSQSDIEQRLAAQMPVPEKALRADYVIYNSGTERTLREQTEMVLRSILEEQTCH